MRRLLHIVQFHLLAALLVVGVMSCAVGITWCRYQRVEELPIQFAVYGPGNFRILAAPGSSDLGMWSRDEESGMMSLDFQVTNGSGTAFAADNSRFSLRLLATEGIPADAEVSLVVTGEDGRMEVYPVDRDAVIFEGKYLSLCNEMGEGYRYRFMEANGSEAVMELEGGRLSTYQCSIRVKGASATFLAELQLVDAAYGDETTVLTKGLTDTLPNTTYLLPDWQVGDANPYTEITFSAQDLTVEGSFACYTKSEFVTPVLHLETDSGEEEVVAQQHNGDAAGNTDAEGGASDGAMEETLVCAKADIVVAASETYELGIELIPNEELLKDITLPVTVPITVEWQFQEDGRAETLAADMVVVLRPAAKPVVTATPAPTPAPTEEPEVTPAPTTEPEATPGPTEEPEATPGPTTEPEATPAPTAEPEATPGPTGEPETTPGPTEEPEATPAPTIIEAGQEVSLEYGTEAELTPAPTEEPAVMVTPAPTEVPVATPAPTEEPTATAAPTAEPEVTATPAPTSAPAATAQPLPGPTDGNVSDESQEESFAGQTFVIKLKDGKQQMAIHGISAQLTLGHSLNAAAQPDATDDLQSLHIVSHKATFEVSLPTGDYMTETMVKVYTGTGYGDVENAPTPQVTTTGITEGESAGITVLSVDANNAPAGTYRLTVVMKTLEGISFYEEDIPFFVNYRFDAALEAELAQEEQGE